VSRLARRVVTAYVADPAYTFEAIRSTPEYIRNVRRYRSGGRSAFEIRARHLYPRLADRRAQAGTASGHYFHQDIWAARRVFEISPARHVDVGSRVDGFVAHLLAFRSVEVVDVRPLTSTHPGLSFILGDAQRLPFEDSSVESLSSLHAVEHFGLGRYGDNVEPDAWRRGLAEFERVLQPGGTLYVSVPIGRERLEFDAHRIFDPQTIPRSLESLVLEEFAAVDDDGRFRQDVAPADFADAWYSCGLYRFRKHNNA
jgi:SAM-dependent methyltransferase